MWAVVNTTPYVAERTWVQDKDANKIWFVVVKATFDIESDGLCRLSEEQVPIFRMAEPLGALGKSSLVYDSDLFGLKPCTDILVNGSAWSPDGKPAAVVDVQLICGSINKRLRVHGDRIWERGLSGSPVASNPQSFESMRIIYERAYGGWDKSSEDPADHRMESRNPLGAGFAVSAGSCIGQALPNIEYPSQTIDSWKDRPAPAGLNAIECHWSPRREFAGTYDDEWKRNRAPLWAEDFDLRYNNSAPQDQQVKGFLKGGEMIDLSNLSPDGRMTFSLPRIYPFFETRFGRERTEHRGQLCTVVIEPDLNRVILAWQTSLICNHRVDELDVTVVSEKRVI